MENRVKRKSFAVLLAEAAKPMGQERAKGLAELFRRRFPDLVKAAPEPAVLHGTSITHSVIDEGGSISRHALDYYMSRGGGGGGSGRIPATVRQKTLRDFDTTELIMELLGRGFAVQKVPEQKP